MNAETAPVMVNAEHRGGRKNSMKRRVSE